jgi:hypothetical protein
VALSTINLNLLLFIYHGCFTKLSYITLAGHELTTLVVIGTDCIGSCTLNYHRTTTTTVPERNEHIVEYEYVTSVVQGRK